MLREGRLGDGHFPAIATKIHPSSFRIHPCSLAGLVVEVDGDVHDLQKEEDERREKVLSVLGLRMVRFTNDEVVKDLSTVAGKIRGNIPAS
jgi:very-short-patch-repair endonuclease